MGGLLRRGFCRSLSAALPPYSSTFFFAGVTCSATDSYLSPTEFNRTAPVAALVAKLLSAGVQRVVPWGSPWLAASVVDVARRPAVACSPGVATARSWRNSCKGSDRGLRWRRH